MTVSVTRGRLATEERRYHRNKPYRTDDKARNKSGGRATGFTEALAAPSVSTTLAIARAFARFRTATIETLVTAALFASAALGIVRATVASFPTDAIGTASFRIVTAAVGVSVSTRLSNCQVKATEEKHRHETS